MSDRAIQFDLDALVEHPFGRRLIFGFRLPLDVVESRIEQGPKCLTPLCLRQDQKAGMQIDSSIERNEICLVVRDEDGLFIDDGFVEGLGR